VEKEYKRASRTNWYDPSLWRWIEEAVKTMTVWVPKDILKYVQDKDPKAFNTLTTQVIGRWMDRDANNSRRSRWSAETLTKVEQCKEFRKVQKKATRSGILVSQKLRQMNQILTLYPGRLP
jgi:hypothetical protein